MATEFSLALDISFALREIVNDTNRRIDARENIGGPDHPFTKALSSGTGTSKIDIGWFRTTPTAIAASGNQNFDVSGGLTDSAGVSLPAATKLVAIFVANYNTAGSLTLRAASATTVPLFVATGTQPGIIIPAAAAADDPGLVLWYANSGMTVAGGSTDLLNLLNNDSSNAAVYRIGFVARSA